MSYMHRESYHAHECNIRCHYSTRHADKYAKYQGEEGEKRGANLKMCLLK